MIKAWASVNEWKNNAEEMWFTGKSMVYLYVLCSRGWSVNRMVFVCLTEVS